MATLSGGALPPPKQIRFVNNQGQPPSKRRRVNAACLTCRRRKTRCDGQKPTCATCEKNGHQCLGYPDHPERAKHDSEAANLKFEGDGASNYGHAGDLDEDLAEDDVKREDDAAGPAEAHTGTQHRDATTTPNGTVGGGGARNEMIMDWELQSTRSQTPARPGSAKRISSQRTVSFSEDGRSSSARSPNQHHHETHKVPYFRYFGPTAIVPGLKQMVVNVHQPSRRRSSRGGSISAASPFSVLSHHSLPSHAETVLEPADDMPVYDPNDPAPVHPLIIDLVKTFFLHLGCIYPFLREEKTLRLVREKKVESILVDAMCALAARFVTPGMLPSDTAVEGPRSEYGNVFAQRAKAATVDTFPCPSVGSVQAYLLMAYEGFGANQDSTLWMYLGLAIRMALDLGLHMTEGVQYHGDQDPWYTRSWGRPGAEEEDESSPVSEEKKLDRQEQQEIVQERIDTAWAVYILDRVISSGTGRPVSLRDDEFELELPTPEAPLRRSSDALPAPYPVFTHIIQLYGRVSDVLNKLKRVEDLNSTRLATLAKLESELTGLHKKHSGILHFNPLKLQNYVKKGQGTLFILLHVWFHACIIIIHQPLLTPFGSRRHQLTPSSRELAMSSAKTIASILAVAELIDHSSYTNSPFTSQPMYIAACAFLTELAANGPVSRAVSPAPGRQNGSATGEKVSKHSLLAEAANESYQRCYKSLQQLHDYWGGVKYIMNALDHRSKGIWDCETYTAEEYASTKQHPRRHGSLTSFPRPTMPPSPQPNAHMLAYALSGTTNSPNSSLSVLWNKNPGPSQTSQPPPPPLSLAHSSHVHHHAPAPVSAPTPPGNMIFDPVRQSLPDNNNNNNTSPFSPSFPQANLSAVRFSADGSGSSSNNRILSPMNPSGPGVRSGIKFDQPLGPVDGGGPNTPTTADVRLQILSGLASNNPVVLPSLHSQPYTPSSNYEPSILQGASPSSSLAATDSQQQQQQQQSRANNNNNNNNSNNNHQNFNADLVAQQYGGQHDFAAAAASYGYMGSNQHHHAPLVDDAIMVQTFDLGSRMIDLPNDMLAPWDLFAGGNFADLFDPTHLDTEGAS